MNSATNIVPWWPCAEQSNESGLAPVASWNGVRHHERDGLRFELPSLSRCGTIIRVAAIHVRTRAPARMRCRRQTGQDFDTAAVRCAERATEIRIDVNVDRARDDCRPKLRQRAPGPPKLSASCGATPLRSAPRLISGLATRSRQHAVADRSATAERHEAKSVVVAASADVRQRQRCMRSRLIIPFMF
jgi:hypothetical protein